MLFIFFCYELHCPQNICHDGRLYGVQRLSLSIVFAAQVHHVIYTETAVAFIDSLLLNLDKNLINGMVLVDYKKALDMAGAYHLDQSSLDWFKSYTAKNEQPVLA